MTLCSDGAEGGGTPGDSSTGEDWIRSRGSSEVDRGGADDGQSGCRDFSSPSRAVRAVEALTGAQRRVREI